MSSAPRLLALALGTVCLIPTTVNAQLIIRNPNGVRPSVPRGLGGGVLAPVPMGGFSNNFTGIPGVFAPSLPTPTPLPTPLPLPMGGGGNGFGTGPGVGGLTFPGAAPFAPFGYNNPLNNAGLFNTLGTVGPLGGLLGGMYPASPFNQLYSPLASPFNGTLTSPFLGGLSSPLNGPFPGLGGLNGLNPGFGGPFGGFPGR